jgi:L-aminopeptidase/D-esterase-like protein
MADDKKPSNYDDVVDAKTQVKQDAAYNAADSTPANPKSTAGAGQGMRGVKKMASGGSASSRADGCAQRGKTKGMVVGMNKGGMSC